MVTPACGPARELDERARCRTLESAEPLLGRIPDTAATERSVFVSELFAMFRANCGRCHVDGDLGDLQITQTNIPEVVDAEVLAILRSNDPEIFMPPPDADGRPYEDRNNDPGDAIVKLATYIEAWLAQESPPDVFKLPATIAGQSPYVYDQAFAEAMTNIGSCVPDVGIVATEAEQSCALDEQFAELENSTDERATDPQWLGLPATLDQTDLTTLDSEELAKRGVISFAPTYPLWSDGAGKMRHVRVPRGESIHFNERTQEFEIPPNTRFYKTFLKKIIDKDGMERMKKMETRIIVARPDRELPDGTFEPTALFGTYIWNEQETAAELLTDHQNDGRPFVDRVLRYIIDEPAAQTIRDELRPGRNLETALFDGGVVRHYAVPGRQRCIHCHMGSPSRSFILGFTPLQVHRRPAGEGGVVEPAGPDELTQLDRLIEYGVITGIDSPEDLVLLEDSQGDRQPRTEQELLAQGYLFGNCAHCHNPRGFASVSAPEIRDLLDFWPRPDGGIFEFPLDRVSPRLKRGPEADVEIPYITPSLRDQWPPTQPATLPVPDWVPKIATEPNPDGTVNFLDAPWRSLIYRNVDTPFIYADDWTIFPHMPRNTAGFDCRAPRIVAEWMVSIPAVRIREPALFNEDGIPYWDTRSTSSIEDLPQPYREVRLGDPEYGDALVAAEERLAEYREGERYGYCVDQTDILDRKVLEARLVTPQDEELVEAPIDHVPDRVHWVAFDETEALGSWFPRRTDHKEVLVDGEVPEVPAPTDAAGWVRKIRRDAEVELVGLLQSVTLDEEIRAFALSEYPLGLWQQKEECDFPATVKTIEEWPTPPLRWMPRADPEHPAHVYGVLPGEAIFGTICINCHGPNADSKGPVAGTLNEMTGGLARVANFRTGLFGRDPEGTLNRDRVFGEIVRDESLDVTAEDLTARYMSWMALGGTKIQIPGTIVQFIKNTSVLDRKRTGAVGTTNLSANMLSVAQELCGGLLGRQKNFRLQDGKIQLDALYANTGLILSNGDAELWETLCNMNNPSPVRVLTAERWDAASVSLLVIELYRRNAYPTTLPDSRVGNHEGRVVDSLTDDNRIPWCILKPVDAAELASAETFVMANGMPFCPQSWLTEANRLQIKLTPDATYRNDDRAWTARGAINAGLAVYLFLNRFIVEGVRPTPRFDRCEELSSD